MTLRYELRAVRLDGEVYPALIDHNASNKLPVVFNDKSKTGYRELIRLIAEYRDLPMIGLTPRDVLHLPQYLSDATVDRIRKADSEKK